jgi:hypothetical protein
MPPDEDKKVLVAIMNSPRDFAIARDEHWYRLPVKRAPKDLEVDYLALYQTRVFGEEKWAINYYAEVRGISIARRRDLLPGEPTHPRADDDYYRIAIGELQRLPRPVVSRRWRRITFVATTLGKLLSASEMADIR